jgi:hypothetical protein
MSKVLAGAINKNAQVLNAESQGYC